MAERCRGKDQSLLKPHTVVTRQRADYSGHPFGVTTTYPQSFDDGAVTDRSLVFIEAQNPGMQAIFPTGFESMHLGCLQVR